MVVLSAVETTYQYLPAIVHVSYPKWLFMAIQIYVLSWFYGIWHPPWKESHGISFNLGICWPAMLWFFCRFNGKCVLGSNSVLGLGEHLSPRPWWPERAFCPLCCGWRGCVSSEEEDSSQVFCEGLWGGVADYSAGEEGWVELWCGGWGAT